MDADQGLEFPRPEINDTEAVRTALETGAQLWSDSSHTDALRWLRRAAETAADAGDDLRSVALARSAADLRNFSRSSGSLLPPGVGSPASGVPFQTAATVPQAGAGGSAASPGGARGGTHNPAQTVPATPAAGAAAALQAASQAARDAAGVANAHSAPSEALAAAATDMVRAPAPQRVEARAPMAQPAQRAQETEGTNGATPVEGVAAFGSGRPRDSRPDALATSSHPPPSLGVGFQTHHSVRVALGPRPNADGQFSVHPLAEGEPVDPGWTEALLVGLVPGKRLFPGRT